MKVKSQSRRKLSRERWDQRSLPSHCSGSFLTTPCSANCFTEVLNNHCEMKAKHKACGWTSRIKENLHVPSCNESGYNFPSSIPFQFALIYYSALSPCRGGQVSPPLSAVAGAAAGAAETSAETVDIPESAAAAAAAVVVAAASRSFGTLSGRLGGRSPRLRLSGPGVRNSSSPCERTGRTTGQLPPP